MKRVDLLKFCQDNKKIYKGYSKCKAQTRIKRIYLIKRIPPVDN